MKRARIKAAAYQYLKSLQKPRETPQLNAGLLIGHASQTPVRVPIEAFLSHGIITGATGTGKTTITLPIKEELLVRGYGWTSIDLKGDMFQRDLYLVAHYPEVWDRTVVIDFSNQDIITPYNIMAPIGDDFDYFVQRRTETLKELLPGKDALSLRAAGLLRHTITALSSGAHALTLIDRFFDDAAFRNRVLKAAPQDTKYYFNKMFPKESPQTIASLRSRISALFTSQSIKRAFSAGTAPDFAALQRDRCIVLVNCAGRTLTRGMRQLLQGIVISDVTQSLNSGDEDHKHVTFCDEAQNLFKKPQQCDDLSTVMNEGRSFGRFLCLICHNVSAQLQPEFKELLRTHIRWALAFRSTPNDLQHLRSVLPVTGRMPKPSRPFQEKQYYTENEERNLLLEGVASLPDRVAWLWVRTGGSAARVMTAQLSFGNNFRQVINRITNDSAFGRRTKPIEAREEENDAEVLFRSMEARYKNIR